MPEKQRARQLAQYPVTEFVSPPAGGLAPSYFSLGEHITPKPLPACQSDSNRFVANLSNSLCIFNYYLGVIRYGTADKMLVNWAVCNAAIPLSGAGFIDKICLIARMRSMDSPRKVGKGYACCDGETDQRESSPGHALMPTY